MNAACYHGVRGVRVSLSSVVWCQSMSLLGVVTLLCSLSSVVRC